MYKIINGAAKNHMAQQTVTVFEPSAHISTLRLPDLCLPIPQELTLSN